MFADVIIDITHEKLDRIFQYSIPSDLEGVLKVGLEVEVPFGRGNKNRTGYIISFSESTDYDVEKIKAIVGVAKNREAIETKLVELAIWMKEMYGGTVIQALKTVMPVKKKIAQKEKKYIRLALERTQARVLLKECQRKKYTAKAKVLEVLLEIEEEQQAVDWEFFIKVLAIPPTTLKSMEKQGSIQIDVEQIYRNPIRNMDSNPLELEYTEEQRNAIDQFVENYETNKRENYLIHGVTGSGKTEVYIEMIRRVVMDGKQAIVLIPEIALTYQTVKRFYRVFGERIAILNSRMTQGERYDQWARVKNGEIDVMIGPRSALFTPFPQLGLIVIDEEHEQTYKSEQIPRFHARETAIRRGEMEGASVVLGSATPSLESYHAAKRGEYQLIELKMRSRLQALPQVEVIDLREELRAGNRSIISLELEGQIRQSLDQGEQIMLFLNRRGYAGFICCRSCGYIKKCQNCDVALAEHSGNVSVCHYCGHQESKAEICPECGSQHIGGFRAGTQQIETIIQKMFPQARTIRMDNDTTREKGSYEAILTTFEERRADILIGTQMIVKGHDFPNVTLVGILAADLSLYANDYRAGERTFQLLTQAAGRAGRGEKSGRVVIQTYNPEHYSILAAKEQDYVRFYEEEIEYRKLMGYPPADHMLAVLMQSENEALLEMGARYTVDIIGKIDREKRTQVIGPTVPYVSKINHIYRKAIYIKSEKYAMLIGIKNYLEQYIEMNSGFDKIYVQFDFDPMNMW